MNRKSVFRTNHIPSVITLSFSCDQPNNIFLEVMELFFPFSPSFKDTKHTPSPNFTNLIPNTKNKSRSSVYDDKNLNPP